MLHQRLLAALIISLGLCLPHTALALPSGNLTGGGNDLVVTGNNPIGSGPSLPDGLGTGGSSILGSSGISPFQTGGPSLGGFEAGNGGNFISGSSPSGSGSILGGGSILGASSSSSGSALGGTTLGGSALGGTTLGSSALGGTTLGGSALGGSSYTPASSSGSLAGGGAIGDLLCQVVYWFLGSLGQGIATLAVITLGIGALMGKVSQGSAITTMVGISVIFGAPNIVQQLTGVAACY